MWQSSAVVIGEPPGPVTPRGDAVQEGRHRLRFVGEVDERIRQSHLLPHLSSPPAGRKALLPPCRILPDMLIAASTARRRGMVISILLITKGDDVRLAEVIAPSDRDRVPIKAHHKRSDGEGDAMARRIQPVAWATAAASPSDLPSRKENVPRFSMAGATLEPPY